MTKSKPLHSKNSAVRWILLGVPVLFAAGSLMHFIYQWSGNLTLVGVFAPVNESVWEHLKLTFWPMLCWWTAGYFLFGRKAGISAGRWFVPCAVAQLVCPLVIMTFYYTYTGALGIESLMLDIFSLFLGLAAGQLMALHIYRYARLNRYWLYGAVLVLILLAAAFTVFTFAPPHLPLFKDSTTGQYGI